MRLELIAAECDNGRDCHRATGREITCQECQRYEQENDGGKNAGICCADIEKQTGNKRRNGTGNDCAANQSDSYKLQSPSNNEPKYGLA